jgi:uncharacterized membrane protein
MRIRSRSTNAYIYILCFLFGTFFSHTVLAQGVETVTARVTHVLETHQNEDGAMFYVFEVQTSDSETYKVDTSQSHERGIWHELSENDKVELAVVNTQTGQDAYFVDVVRIPALTWMIILFLALVLAVGLLRGFWSIIGLMLSVGILAFFLFPSILAGYNPVLVTILASAVILAVNIHIAHGFRIRTFFAFLGTLAGMTISILFAYLFAYGADVSGLGSEEATLLLWDVREITNPVLIYISAIVLGTVGILDDVAVTQSEIVEELAKADPSLDRAQLFKRALRVGRHHIASTVNTLILVYAGASLPTFLLAQNYTIGLSAFVNNAQVAEEIIRMLAGTIALILTVPIATALATIPSNK